MRAISREVAHCTGSLASQSDAGLAPFRRIPPKGIGSGLTPQRLHAGHPDLAPLAEQGSASDARCTMQSLDDDIV